MASEDGILWSRPSRLLGQVPWVTCLGLHSVQWLWPPSSGMCLNRSSFWILLPFHTRRLVSRQASHHGVVLTLGCTSEPLESFASYGHLGRTPSSRIWWIWGTARTLGFFKVSLGGSELPWWLSWWRIHLQCRRPGFDPWVGKIPWRRDRLPTSVFLGFPGGSDGKESTCHALDLGLIPGLGRSSGKEMTTHSCILAWRIPWTEEPGGLQSMGSKRVGHNWTIFTFTSSVILMCSQTQEPRPACILLVAAAVSLPKYSQTFLSAQPKMWVHTLGFPAGPVLKNWPANAGDMVLINQDDSTRHGETEPMCHSYWVFVR